MNPLDTLLITFFTWSRQHLEKTSSSFVIALILNVVLVAIGVFISWAGLPPIGTFITALSALFALLMLVNVWVRLSVLGKTTAAANTIFANTVRGASQALPNIQTLITDQNLKLLSGLFAGLAAIDIWVTFIPVYKYPTGLLIGIIISLFFGFAGFGWNTSAAWIPKIQNLLMLSAVVVFIGITLAMIFPGTFGWITGLHSKHQGFQEQINQADEALRAEQQKVLNSLLEERNNLELIKLRGKLTVQEEQRLNEVKQKITELNTIINPSDLSGYSNNINSSSSPSYSFKSLQNNVNIWSIMGLVIILAALGFGLRTFFPRTSEVVFAVLGGILIIIAVTGTVYWFMTSGVLETPRQRGW